MQLKGTQIMLNKLDYTYIWKLLKEFGVTHYCAAPTVQNELCNHPDAVRLQRTVRTFSGGMSIASYCVVHKDYQGSTIVIMNG